MFAVSIAEQRAKRALMALKGESHFVVVRNAVMQPFETPCRLSDRLIEERPYRCTPYLTVLM